MNQRTQEWFEARAGKITASNFHKLAGVKGLGKGGETYLFELIANEMGAMNDEVNAFALQYGTDMEPIAREYLCKALNVEVEEVGFITAKFDKEIGYSADGIIKEGNRGLEIKCPLVVENHLKYMTIKTAADLKKIEPKYYWQVIFSMYCSGLKSWLFVSFNPKFNGADRMHCININADEKEFDFIKERIEEAKKLKEEIKLKLEL